MLQHPFDIKASCLLKVVIAACLGLSGSFWVNSSLAASVRPTEDDSIRIVHPDSSQPFAFLDKTGKPQGMTIDLWRLWSEKTGIDIEFIHGSWKETIRMMQEGRADVHSGLVYNDGDLLHVVLQHYYDTR